MSSAKPAHTLWRTLSSRTIYETVPPYNLGWFRSFAAFDTVLSNNPICLVDVGARGGSCEELEPLQKYVSYTGFDADKRESDRLNASPPQGYRSFEVFPYYVGARSGPQEFHLYRQLGTSSQLLPSREFQESFSADLVIDKTVSVEGITLDDFLEKSGRCVDVLKLDTQGTELEVLKNAGRVLDQALMVESEVEFVEMYQGQALYHDVAAHLYQRGFVLLYLNRVFGNREKYKGATRGQILFGDALFGVSRERARRLGWEKQLKYCVLLINYGHLDFAHEIFMDSPALQENVPALAALFQNEIRAGTSWLAKRKRRMIHRLEKLAYAFLWYRRTNGLPCDSDRSWPVR